MKPPRAALDRMHSDGPLGAMASIVALGAALAVKRGCFGPLESVTDPKTGKAFSEELQMVLRRVHTDCVTLLRDATPDELEHAIGLYTAHLKEAGYTIEAGYGN